MFTSPWWLFCVVAFAVGYISGLKSGEAFLLMAIGGLILWGGYCFVLDSANGGQLSTRIAETFRLPSGTILLLMATVVGALLSALSGLSGALLNRLMAEKNG